jgi:hypothetical protein
MGNNLVVLTGRGGLRARPEWDNPETIPFLPPKSKIGAR